MSVWLPRHAQLSVVAASHVGRVAATRPGPLLVLGARHLHLHNVRHARYVPRTFPLASQRFASSDASASASSSEQKPEQPKPAKEIVEHKEPLGTRVWKKVKHEAQHYWHGSKLLVSEVRIASRLQLKILRGGSLTRRERRQVHSQHTQTIYETDRVSS
jgi:LETM1 and EF-hand domain-containing protein 1